MAEIPKDAIAKAYAAVNSEEREKAFLKARSRDAPSLTPPDEYIDASLGKARSPQEQAAAILDRAKAYQRNNSPAPDYVVFPEPKKTARQEAVQSLLDKAKERLAALGPSRDRER